METLLCFWMYNCKSRATYRQFTNAAWDWIIKKLKTKTKTKQQKTKKNQNCTKSGLSQFLLLQQKM